VGAVSLVGAALAEVGAVAADPVLQVVPQLLPRLIPRSQYLRTPPRSLPHKGD
jgi:hypothetical protein